MRQRVPTFAQRYFFTFLALLKAIPLARQHDVVHTATFNSVPPAWLAGKLAGRKTVLTAYEVWDKKWYSLSGQSRPKATLLRWIERMLLWFRLGVRCTEPERPLRERDGVFLADVAVLGRGPVPVRVKSLMTWSTRRGESRDGRLAMLDLGESRTFVFETEREKRDIKLALPWWMLSA